MDEGVVFTIKAVETLSQPLQTYSVHKVDPAPYAVESQFTRTTALRTSFLQHVGQVLMTWSNNSHQLGSAEAF